MRIERGSVAVVGPDAVRAPASWRGERVQVLDVKVFGWDRTSCCWCERGGLRRWVRLGRLDPVESTEVTT